MKNSDLSIAINKLEKEIQYLYTDYKRMLSQYEAFNEINAIRIKIKQAEESLRLKKRMLYVSLN